MGVSSHEDEGVDCRSEISVSACGVAEVLPARHFYVVQCDVFFTENGMETKDETHSNTLKSWLRDSYVGRLFWDKSFLHYFWTGGLFTFLNIFLVWLFIDIFKIPTLISSTVVIGGLFIIRYAVYRWLKIM